MSAPANERTASTSPGIIARLAAIDDGNILRVAFYALLIGTASVLFVDFRELFIPISHDAVSLVSP